MCGQIDLTRSSKSLCIVNEMNDIDMTSEKTTESVEIDDKLQEFCR